MATTTNLNLIVDQSANTKFRSESPSAESYVKNIDDNMRKIDQFAGDVIPIKATNVLPVFSSDNTYNDYPYKGTISILGVTSMMRPEVIFGLEEAVSANYAPICESGTDCVYIYAKVNTAIVIPSVIVYKE